MEEPFVLEVEYNGKMHELPAQLQFVGYIHRFIVTLPQTDVWFERDEEGSYRAILPPETPEKVASSLKSDFLQAIALQIQTILA